MIVDTGLFVLMCAFAYIITIGWMFLAIYWNISKYFFFPKIGYVSWVVLTVALNWLAFS